MRKTERDPTERRREVMLGNEEKKVRSIDGHKGDERKAERGSRGH